MVDVLLHQERVSLLKCVCLATLKRRRRAELGLQRWLCMCVCVCGGEKVGGASLYCFDGSCVCACCLVSLSAVGVERLWDSFPFRCKSCGTGNWCAHKLKGSPSSVCTVEFDRWTSLQLAKPSNSLNPS